MFVFSWLQFHNHPSSKAETFGDFPLVCQKKETKTDVIPSYPVFNILLSLLSRALLLSIWLFHCPSQFSHPACREAHFGLVQWEEVGTVFFPLPDREQTHWRSCTQSDIQNTVQFYSLTHITLGKKQPNVFSLNTFLQWTVMKFQSKSKNDTKKKKIP